MTLSHELCLGPSWSETRRALPCGASAAAVDGRDGPHHEGLSERARLLQESRVMKSPWPRRTIPWDSADYLKTDEDIAYYLEAAFEDGDPALITAALGDVARAKGMSQVAQAAGLGRESLYKALSKEGNPEFATVLKVLRALGLRLKVAV
jgi:probable addiction module antidote protein